MIYRYSEDGTVSMTELQRACEDFFCVGAKPRRVLSTHNATDNVNHKQRVGAISSDFDGLLCELKGMLK